MGIFSRIMDKLRSHSPSAAAPPASASQPTAGQSSSVSGGRPTQQQTQDMSTPMAQQGGMGTQSGLQAEEVDVDAVLTKLAARKGGGGNWRTSIVDLLKLLDLDSGMDARKELAQELHVNAGEHGSAEQNIALHKAVMRKIAENGGRVPDSMRD